MAEETMTAECAMPRPIAISICLAVLTVTPPVQAAQPQSFRADYSVTLMGLPVAKASFDSTFTADSFRIEGSLSSSGIGRIVEKVDGTTSVHGAIGKNGALPHSFVSAYRTDRKQSQTKVTFSGGAVASAVNTPQPKRGADWIPVPKEELRAALDPLTSTLIRAADPAQVCNRTIRMFDGEMRADLRLTHRGTGRVRGHDVQAVTCDARFVPVAGYRDGRKQIEFLKNRSRIAISFIPLGTTGFYTPADATVGTQVGTLRIRLSRLEAR
jgi:hypothetical protein